MNNKYIFILSIFNILVSSYFTVSLASESLESLLARATRLDKKIELYSSAEPAIAEFWKLAKQNDRLSLDRIKEVLAEMRGGLGGWDAIDSESAKQFIYRIVSTFRAGSSFYEEDVPNLSYHFRGYKTADIIIDLVFSICKAPSGKNLFLLPGSREEHELEDDRPHPVGSIVSLIIPANGFTSPNNDLLSPMYLRRQYKMAEVAFMLLNISFTDPNRGTYFNQLLQTTDFLAAVIQEGKVKSNSPQNKKILKLRENLRINFSNWIDQAIFRSTFDPALNDILVRLSSFRSTFHLRNCKLELGKVGADFLY